MVKFGSYTLPHVLRMQKMQGWQLQEVPLPGRMFPYRKAIAGLGSTFTINGEIRPSSQLVKDELCALADGTPRILDFEESVLTVLEKCFRWQTGPVWTDNTAESQSPGGTPFTLLGAATDYSYFGHREKLNKLQFDLGTLGNYGPFTLEYSKGVGVWGTLDLDTLYDDFPGATLDTGKWSLLQGSVSVAGGVLTLNPQTELRSNSSYGPYYRTTAKLAPKQIDKEFLFYPVYIDSNNFIRLHFFSTGHIYFGSNKNGNFYQIDVGAYDNAQADYIITWTASQTRLYKNGSLLGTINSANYIPTAAAKFNLYTLNLASADVDYIKYTLNDGTAFFSQDGTISFTPPSDWKQDTLNEIGSKFWVRTKVPTVTTSATVNQIQINRVFNCIMLNPSFNETAENYNKTPYSLTFVQQENP